jgi:hypothetical protein
MLGEEVGFADYLTVWTRYVEGWVDAGGELPF